MSIEHSWLFLLRMSYGSEIISSYCTPTKIHLSWQRSLHSLGLVTDAWPGLLTLMQPTYCSRPILAAVMITMINVFIFSHLLALTTCTDNCLLLILPWILPNVWMYKPNDKESLGLNIFWNKKTAFKNIGTHLMVNGPLKINTENITM